MVIVDTAEDADFFIDDLIDSGTTADHWYKRFPQKPFYALITKAFGKFEYEWLVFPWEGDAEGSIEDNIVRLLQFFGEDPARGGLLETPKRVAKAWKHWTSGYTRDPMEVLKVFEDGADRCDEMVVVRDIPFYSQCEHHLAPFFGTATVAYIPDGKIVGLSKLSRLVDIFARRLQVQERLTNQIADALVDGLDPKGVGVVIQARHLCMESRGICQQGHSTVTSALRGVLKDTPSARAEFLSLASHK
jgi:GTP cyclohydrolase I